MKYQNSKRDFLTLTNLTAEEAHKIIDRAIIIKKKFKIGEKSSIDKLFKGKTLGLVFNKSSTRTRVSFEVAATQMGGRSIFLSDKDTQIARGEPIKDTARVLSRMLDLIVVRTFKHDIIEEFANYSKVPVINALTDFCHPCQIMADVMTYIEYRSEIQDKKIVWLGDGNNVCQSFINGSNIFQYNLKILSPPSFTPIASRDKNFTNIFPRVQISDNIVECCKDADMIVTDVWRSMGQEQEGSRNIDTFLSYQVNSKIMSLAKPDALLMHCLPAHRDEEITEDVLEGKNSVVWDEAENRLHVQKAIIEFLLTKTN